MSCARITALFRVLIPLLAVPVLYAENSSAKPQTFEFRGDDIQVVLKQVARTGGLAIRVHPSIRGTVTMRLAQKTPREVIDIIAQSNHLKIQDVGGAVYVQPYAQPIRIKTLAVEKGFLPTNTRLIRVLANELNAQKIIESETPPSNCIWVAQSHLNHTSRPTYVVVWDGASIDIRLSGQEAIPILLKEIKQFHGFGSDPIRFHTGVHSNVQRRHE